MAVLVRQCMSLHSGYFPEEGFFCFRVPIFRCPYHWTRMSSEMLEALGTTAEAVASTLRTKGIQGVANTVRDLNPIVRYVRSQVGETQTVHLIGDVLTIHFADGRQQKLAIPAAVREFLHAFNGGQYVDLHLPTTG
jgi:hypothetical protein